MLIQYREKLVVNIHHIVTVGEDSGGIYFTVNDDDTLHSVSRELESRFLNSLSIRSIFRPDTHVDVKPSTV